MNSNDKVAVVTGAASGIGLALVREGLARGLRISAADTDAVGLAKMELLASRERLLLSLCDVGECQHTTTFARETFQNFGRVDYVFNNAGIFASGSILDVTPASWQKVLNVNVLGVVNVIQAFVPRLLEQQNKSRMIITSSISSFATNRLVGPYSASKYAVLAIAHTLYKELRRETNRVGVSLLVPGAVQTGLLSNSAVENADTVVEALSAAMISRGESPDDVARKVFNGIDASSFLIAFDRESLVTQAQASLDQILNDE